MADYTGTSGPDVNIGTAYDDSMDGGAGNDWLQGVGGDDILVGGLGNDALWAGPGDDMMTGGDGNDTYLVEDFGDIVNETSTDPTQIDRVHASIDLFLLPDNIENLRLFGTTAIYGYGNDLDNTIQGNVLANTLAGGLGNDTYIISDLTDTLIENAGEGTHDTIQSSVTVSLLNYANIEDIILTGKTAINAFGDDNDNVLTGNSARNTLSGGLGNDTYVLDNTTDVLVDTGGLDTIQSSITYTLATKTFIENLTLTGTAAINATGNLLDNTLTGNIGVNTLDGGIGADTMIGGGGSDFYIVDNTGDKIVELLGEGTDSVRSTVSYILDANIESLTLSGKDPINGTGNALNNIITGNTGANSLTGLDGDDTLTGGTGADIMDGGTGNDTMYVDNALDTIIDISGTEQAYSSVSYDMSLHATTVEKLTLTGSAAIGTGNALDNVINGTSTVNTLYGNDGVDTLSGLAGNDKLFGGIGDDTLLGGSGNDTLNGDAGNDTLNGGGEADVMYGGIGDDLYFVANPTAKVFEDAGNGTDTVSTSVTYTLSANVENMIWTGSVGTGTGNVLDNVMTGNTSANIFNGLDGADTLIGAGGNDTLDGGFGVDTMTGGTGNDIFVVDSVNDVVNENIGEGTDTVKSFLAIDLANYANVENVTLTGTDNVNATGSAVANVLTGNSGNNLLTGLADNDTLYGMGGVDTLLGGDGDDTLDGGDGIDTLTGGDGNDSYYVSTTSDVVVEVTGHGTGVGEGGVDTVFSPLSFSIATLPGIENITLIGNLSHLTAVGNDGDNTLTAASGISTLIGGVGGDTYVIDKNDIVIETITDHTDKDTVVVGFDKYVLTSNFENLTLSGNAVINGTGNENDNVLTGNSAANTLNGLAGADTMLGGEGNDTYIVDNIGDQVTEGASAGLDTVLSAVDFTLGDNIENLTLTSPLAMNGTGNAGDNYIIGSTSANTLMGLDGNDTLDGGTGADTMDGGIGNDVYYVDSALDVVLDVTGGIETIYSSAERFDMSTNATEVEILNLTGAGIRATGNALDNTITGTSGLNILDGGAGDDTLNGGIGADSMTGGTGDDTFMVDNINDKVFESTGGGHDIVISTVNYSLASTLDVEDLTLSGTAISGTGNSGDNIITGNASANTLEGGAGADTLIGGSGNDVYIIDDTNNTIVENGGAGTDVAQAKVSYTIAENVENLVLLEGYGNINGTGNGGDNTITGNSGANVMAGGAGNDSYIISSSGVTFGDYMLSNDTVVESSSGGNDTIYADFNFSLVGIANVESLTLTGKTAIYAGGNDDDNTLTGNSAANILAGGLGNDTYVIDAKDVVHENANGGNDTVMIGATYSLLTVGHENIENITLTGKGNYNATGNDDVNILTGSDGNNILDGGIGADTMIGGLGNDTYKVDHVNDSITELGGAGTDIVISTVSYHLSDNIENLTLIGGVGVNIDGYGNDVNNIIKGTSGDNILNGGLGADTMDGGAGNDTYYVDNLGDVIKDTSGHELVYSSMSFYTLGTGLEDLTLTGGGNGTGNSLSNVIHGDDQDNGLDGGTGADLLIGGLGGDTYFVDNIGDRVIELMDQGNDTINTSISYDLSIRDDYVENLTLRSGTANLNGKGNDLGNYIFGNQGSNYLDGGGGDDTLDGGPGGRDTLHGGAGHDTFELHGDAINAIDIIQDFDPLQDQINIQSIIINPLLDVIDDFVSYRNVGNDTAIFVDMDGQGTDFGFHQIALLLNVHLGS
ncbi:MAG: calcium-binding protein [Micavibrio sp.]|nr:calcium-binding protein [Micavibrio sp.]